MKSALYFAGCEEMEKNTISQPHFLDSCFLCQKPLALNHDIFMYRGNTPFCSQECRQEQIEMDDGKERRWKRSSNRKSSASSATATATAKIASSDSRKESSAVAVA